MYEFLQYRVEHVMTRKPVVIREDTPLREVGRLFEARGFNGLPVVDGDAMLVGVVTKLDFLKAFSFSPESIVPRYAEILARPARVVMKEDPERVDPAMPLTRVLERMVATRLRSFPVVEGNRLVGVIAREDVMAAVRRAAERKGPAENRE